MTEPTPRPPTVPSRGKTSRRNLLKLAGMGAGAALMAPSLAKGVTGGLPDTADAPAAGAAPFRVGQWLPSDHRALQQWLTEHIRKADADDTPLHPLLEEFKGLIEGDPALFMYFNQMFTQVPRKSPYDRDPTGKPQVRDYLHMLRLINAVLKTAPEYNRTGLVGFPINAILDWPMGTPGGFAAFLNPRVNGILKRILDEWARFLGSERSLYVLNSSKNGWFGPDAREAMPGFEQDFRCDPARPHHGFRSWDDFFTREFREGRRPVASPGDDAVLVNACESAPYRVAHGVRERDRFWIKSQPYSLAHMLAGDDSVGRFVGGTIYQAFLSATSYHRWHSPVGGTVLRTRLIDGSYYAEALSEGFDPAGPNESQGFITGVAARGLILIEADNPAIGLVGFLAVGMAEVSTCDITVRPGQKVAKGDQLGMFHFGGSTHCLIFRPGVKLDFDLHGQKPGLNASNIPVRAAIATVRA
ncbi:MAG: phosphatidylserine decarboxylase family protein [Acidobacteria bacterium]|nr:phosphatidylserine decarboxylase family protein [Acidobacteriota bacterium]